jgi:hypothetical protein
MAPTLTLVLARIDSPASIGYGMLSYFDKDYNKIT